VGQFWAPTVAWIGGIVYYDMDLVYWASDMHGEWSPSMAIRPRAAALAHGVWHIAFFFFFELSIFVFCYGRILVVIRRQARVTAGHSEPGPSTPRENQPHQIQTNVIKTMITIGAGYVITWTPTFVFYMLQHICRAAECIMRGYSPDFLGIFLYLRKPVHLCH